MTLRIRPICDTDFDGWWPLFAAYCEFYEVAPNEAKARTVFESFFIELPPLHCLVAETDLGLVGFAHFKRYFESLSAGFEANLDDLFVSPEARGRGVARALIEAVAEAAAQGNASVLRWITAADNERAQRLYDQVATRTTWLTYEIGL